MADSPETKIEPLVQERRSLRRIFPALLLVMVLGALGIAALVGWQDRKPTREDGPGYHWQQALQALQADDLPLAKTHLAQCLEVWPIHAEAHFLLARACRRTDDPSSWQAHLRRAEVLGWDKDSVHFERDLMQAQRGNLRQVEEGLLAELASPSPEGEIAFEALAKGYLKTHQLDALLALTRQWMERSPDHWQPRLFRGRVFQLGHSTDAAIAEYRQVLELKPDQLDARRELADVLMMNAEYQKALEEFQTYLPRRPDDPDAQVGLANCQFSLGQFEAARATLAALFAKHKEHAAGYFVRAKVELALNQPNEALHWLRRAEVLAPHEPDITYNLVLALRRVGQQEEAKKYEQQLQAIRRQFDRLDDLKKQILSNPRSAALRQQAGAVALDLGRNEEAMHWLESALQLEPNHGPTHKLLAEYYEKVGDRRRAADHRRQAEGK